MTGVLNWEDDCGFGHARQKAPAIRVLNEYRRIVVIGSLYT